MVFCWLQKLDNIDRANIQAIKSNGILLMIRGGTGVFRQVAMVKNIVDKTAITKNIVAKMEIKRTIVNGNLEKYC